MSYERRYLPIGALNSLDQTIGGDWTFTGDLKVNNAVLRAWTDTNNQDVFHLRNNSGTADIYAHWSASTLEWRTESSGAGNPVLDMNADGSVTFWNNASLRGDGDVVLSIIADQANLDEAANPYISMSQDGGVVASMFGHTGSADQLPDGSALTGVPNNSLVLYSTQGITIAAGGGNLRFVGTDQTGVAVTASAIHAALVNLGLITA